MRRSISIIILCCILIVGCENNEPVIQSDPIDSGGSESGIGGGQPEETINPQTLTISSGEEIPDDVPAQLFFGGLGGGPGIPFHCWNFDEHEGDIQIDQYPSGNAIKTYCYCVNDDPGSESLDVRLTFPDQSSVTLEADVNEYTETDFCAEFEYDLGSSPVMDTHTIELSIGSKNIFQQFMPVPGYLFYGFRANEPVRLILFTSGGSEFIAERYVNADDQGNLYFQLSKDSAWDISGGSIDKDKNQAYPVVFAIGQSTSCKMINPGNSIDPRMVEYCGADYIDEGEYGIWNNPSYEQGDPISSDQEEWSPCAGSYPSRLHTGDDAYVAYDPPYKNNVRANAGKNSKLVGQIEPGEEFNVLDGPECANGWVWWKISSYSQTLVGWTSEGDEEDYWLVPID